MCFSQLSVLYFGGGSLPQIVSTPMEPRNENHHPYPQLPVPSIQGASLKWTLCSCQLWQGHKGIPGQEDPSHWVWWGGAVPVLCSGECRGGASIASKVECVKCGTCQPPPSLEKVPADPHPLGRCFKLTQ